MDRKTGPEIKNIENIEFPKISSFYLDNGIKVLEVNKGTQELVQMEIIHKSGRIVEDKQLASRATAVLLKEGTASYSASQLAEKIDFYGANISTGANMDTSFINLFTLNKYFDDLIPVVTEVFSQPVFLSDELEKFKKTSIQKLTEDLSKNELLSYRIVTEEMFGEEHPYGYSSSQEMYRSLTRADLMHHFDQYLGTDNCFILLSGKITDHIRNALNKNIGALNKKSAIKEIEFPKREQKHVSIRKKGGTDVQTAIKIGRRLFSRQHKDYMGLYVTNIILGGYFGSRLMSSIREEKGYTYNIYSAFSSLLHDGFFFISTEVGNGFVEDTVDEIYRQIHLLQTETVDDKEMTMVRNYLMGHFLSMLDGPFITSQIVKTMELNGLNHSFYDDFVSKIKNITSEEIIDLAQTYLNKEDMIEVLIGP